MHATVIVHSAIVDVALSRLYTMSLDLTHPTKMEHAASLPTAMLSL